MTMTIVSWLVTGRQEFGVDNGDLDLAAADGNELVDGKENDGTEDEVVGESRLDHASCSVQQHQDEEDRIAQMDDPERTERVCAGVLDAEDEYEEELERQQ